MTPRQLRRGCIWILIMAGWGYVEHRLPLAWSVLLAVVVFLAVGALVVARSLKSGERPSGLWLLPACRDCGLGAGVGSDFQSCLRNRDHGASGFGWLCSE